MQSQRWLLLCMLVSTSAQADKSNQRVPDAPELLADFYFEGGDTDDDHFHFGLAMGAKYREAIRARMALNVAKLMPFLATDAGKAVYAKFLADHKQIVPKLVRELEGIAQGSNLSFETIFANSLSQEFSLHSDDMRNKIDDHCTDYTFCLASRCVGGHNEDSNLQDHKLFTAYVKLGEANFTVVNYAGDLAGGMSGGAFNSAGLAFSLNRVGPPKAASKGLGRNFISRMLLEAKGLDEAISIAVQTHIGGHNYQLFDFASRRITNIEVANDMHAVRPVSKPFFHTNQYRTLNVPNQTFTTSSAHRTARFLQLPPPETPEDILRLLGDQHDRSYPVFHDQHSHDLGELSDWTLASVLFDLDHCSMSLMNGNPARLSVLRHFTVPGCNATRTSIVV